MSARTSFTRAWCVTKPKGDLDWWRVARDILAQEKANYVVMMMGVSDRQSIRERDPRQGSGKKKGKDQADKPAAEKEAQNKEQSDESGADARCRA